MKLSTLVALYVLPCCWRGIKILPRLEKLDKNQSLGDNFTDKTTPIGFNVSNRNTLKLLYSLSSFNFPDPCHNYEKSSSLRAMRGEKKWTFPLIEYSMKHLIIKYSSCKWRQNPPCCSGFVTPTTTRLHPTAKRCWYSLIFWQIWFKQQQMVVEMLYHSGEMCVIYEY